MQRYSTTAEPDGLSALMRGTAMVAAAGVVAAMARGGWVRSRSWAAQLVSRFETLRSVFETPSGLPRRADCATQGWGGGDAHLRERAHRRLVERWRRSLPYVGPAQPPAGEAVRTWVTEFLEFAAAGPPMPAPTRSWLERALEEADLQTIGDIAHVLSGPAEAAEVRWRAARRLRALCAAVAKGDTAPMRCDAYEADARLCAATLSAIGYTAPGKALTGRAEELSRLRYGMRIDQWEDFLTRACWRDTIVESVAGDATITARQLELGMVLLGWTRKHVAGEMKIGERTLRRVLEGKEEERPGAADARLRLMARLIKAGVRFLPGGGVDFEPPDDDGGI